MQTEIVPAMRSEHKINLHKIHFLLLIHAAILEMAARPTHDTHSLDSFADRQRMHLLKHNTQKITTWQNENFELSRHKKGGGVAEREETVEQGCNVWRLRPRTLTSGKFKIGVAQPDPDGCTYLRAWNMAPTQHRVGMRTGMRGDNNIDPIRTYFQRQHCTAGRTGTGWVEWRHPRDSPYHIPKDCLVLARVTFTDPPSDRTSYFPSLWSSTFDAQTHTSALPIGKVVKYANQI